MRYKIEPYPPIPESGMITGRMPSGVTVTDTETGLSYACTKHRSQHLNRDECIKVLQEMWMQEQDGLVALCDGSQTKS